MLAAKRNNFLASVVVGRDAVGIAYIDITTGEFAVTQFSIVRTGFAAQQEIARVGPAEVLVEAILVAWAVAKTLAGDRHERKTGDKAGQQWQSQRQCLFLI